MPLFMGLQSARVVSILLQAVRWTYPAGLYSSQVGAAGSRLRPAPAVQGADLSVRTPSEGPNIERVPEALRGKTPMQLIDALLDRQV